MSDINLKSRVDFLLAEKKMTSKEFINKLGWTNQNYYRVLSASDLRVSTLEKIAEGLEVDVSLLITSNFSPTNMLENSISNNREGMIVEKSNKRDDVMEEIIKEGLRKKGINVSEIARQVGMSEAGFYKALKNHSFKAVTIKQISEVLEMPISEILGVEDPSSIDKPRKRDELIEELRAQMDLLKEQGEMMRSQIRDLKRDKDFLQSIVMEKLGLKLSDLGKCKVVAMPTVEGYLRKSA